MFDIGFPELLIILGVALIVLGPQRLPEIARTLGRALAELRRTSEDLRHSVLFGEGPENEPPRLANPLEAKTAPQEHAPSEETGGSGETLPEKGVKENGPSESTQSPSRGEG
jgi:TatA/E family protein of Tat protein translocase